MSPPRTARFQTYAFFWAFFAAVLFLTHLGYLRLPYFWDEARQFVPAALDMLHDGALIPTSTDASIHPPGVPAYLAAAWRVAGATPVVTRSAMLILSAFGLLAAFLLAIELAKEARGMPAFLAVVLLAACPLFFAQSMMAQLDAPAMVFTALALLAFLQDRFMLSAAICVALVMVKETGAVTPLMLGAWLARERRWREAGYFAAPLVVLAGWIGVLYSVTGEWAGNRGFVQYNLYYPLDPVRLAVNLLRRLYYLAAADFRWLGTVAVAIVWRHGFLRGRPWRVAAWLAAGHVALFTVLGGAGLERYLLPVMPLIFAAIASALSLFKKRQRMAASAMLLAASVAGSFLNPPYPFPYENNLAYTDFVRLHDDAAGYLARWYPLAQVDTAWPLSMELEKPELGYVKHSIEVRAMTDLSPGGLAGTDWRTVEVMVLFSRRWDPEFSLMHLEPIERFWQHFFQVTPNVTESEGRAIIPFPVEAHFDKRGQWVDIYVNPEVRRHGPARVRTASTAGAP